MKSERLFGMVQPKIKKGKLTEVYKVGCLGKIISFNETEDNRFIINLSGIIRFKIKEEINSEKLYRKFNVNYADFIEDLDITNKEISNAYKKDLLKKIKIFFEKVNYSIEVDELMKLNFDQLISTVSMIAPFTVEEKQKIMETIKFEEKIKTLEKIINFNLIDNNQNKTIQ